MSLTNSVSSEKLTHNISQFDYIDLLPFPVLIQKKHKIFYCNKKAENLIKAAFEGKIYGHNFYKILNIKTEDELEINLESTIKKLSGDNLHLEININRKNVDGTIEEIITFRDITESKNKIELLENNVEKFSSIIERVPVAVVLTVGDKIETINKAGLKLLEETKEDTIKGNSIRKYIDLEKSNMKAVYQSLFEKSVEPKEIDIAKKNGEIIKDRYLALPMMYKGKVAVISIVNDVTNINILKHKMDCTEKKYKNLLDMLPYSVCVHKNYKYTYVNQRFADYYNFQKPKDVIGRRIDQVVSAESYDEIMKRINQVIASEAVLQPQLGKYKNDLGEEVYLESSSRKFFVEGEPNVITVLRDVSESVKYQELKLNVMKDKIIHEKNKEYEKMKTDFISKISHELRTPLNILFNSNKIISTYISKSSMEDKVKVSSYIEMIDHNCYRLTRLVNNLIDISSIDAGYFKMDYKNCEIISLIKEITLAAAEYIKDKDIEIKFETEIQKKIIYCDPEKIARIILNLISNSIKCTETVGKINVKVQDRGNEIVLSVKDTGCGISADKTPMVFERFSQLEDMFTRRKEGTGVGLSIVKYLVERHGGKIKFNSKPGQGTEFLVTFANYKSAISENIVDIKAIREDFLERINIEFSDI